MSLSAPSRPARWSSTVLWCSVLGVTWVIAGFMTHALNGGTPVSAHYPLVVPLISVLFTLAYLAGAVAHLANRSADGTIFVSAFLASVACAALPANDLVRGWATAFYLLAALFGLVIAAIAALSYADDG